MKLWTDSATSVDFRTKLFFLNLFIKPSSLIFVFSILKCIWDRLVTNNFFHPSRVKKKLVCSYTYVSFKEDTQ